MTDFIKKGLTPNEAYEKAIQQHRAEVSVTFADLSVFRNRAGNAEALQAYADFNGRSRKAY